MAAWQATTTDRDRSAEERWENEGGAPRDREPFSVSYPEDDRYQMHQLTALGTDGCPNFFSF